MKNLFFKKNKAFTLVELLIVLGLAFVIIVLGIYLILPKIKGTQLATIENKNIETVVNGIGQLYTNKNTFNDVSNEALMASKILPDRMYSSTAPGMIVNQFGGSIIVEADNIGSNTAKNSYRLTWPQVPDYECYYLIRELKDKYMQVGVNGTSGAALVKDYSNGRIATSDELLNFCVNGANTIYIWNN